MIPSGFPKMAGLRKCLVVLTACLSAAEGRLSTDIRPASYNLSLDLTGGLNNPAGTYKGSVQILVNVTMPRKTIELYAAGMSVSNSSIEFRNKYGELAIVSTFSHNTSNNILSLVPIEELEVGNYVLTLTFEAKFQPDLSGFYRNSYMENGITRWVASTQFESASARKAFPCFDEPRFRANFTLDVTVPMDFHAVSNMPVQSTTDNNNGTKKIHFQTAPAMPTYLFAWYIGETASFGEMASSAVNGISYGVHGRLSLKSEATYALESAPKVIQQLENFTAVPYNNAGLPKMDQVAVPDFNAGAMENWGFVTYREYYLLYNALQSSEVDKQKILLIITHEFTHQWFGDSVTLEWWSYTWLNEAFARYFQYLASSKIEPSWMVENQFLTDVLQLSMDSDYDSHPLTNPNVTTVPEIDDMFDVITYSKGASILRMFSTIIGEENFKSWLNKYLTNVVSTGRVATPDDLWAALNLTLPNTTLTARFKQWTEVGDHPVVNVSKVVSSESTLLRLSQVKEAMNGSQLETHLEVPISFHSSAQTPLSFTLLNDSSAHPGYLVRQLNSTLGLDEYFWLKSNETAHVRLNSTSPEWYLINPNTTGYYRVLYDEANWRALRTAIFRSEIPPLIRAQLVSDALNLMASGYLQPETAMEFVGFLSNETDLLVWKSALMAFSSIRDLVAGWDSAKLALEERVKLLMDEAFVMTFVEPPTSYDHYQTVLRSYVASQICHYKTKSCENLRSINTANLASAEEHDRELDGAFFCQVVKTDPWMWAEVLAKYQNASSPTAKRRFLASLTCTNETATQLKLLNFVLDPSVILRQDYTVVSTVSEAQNGPQSVMEFLKANGTRLANYLSNKEQVKKILSAVARQLVNPKMLDDFDKVLQTTDLGLTKEEKNNVISKARKTNEKRSLVANRLCVGLSVVCTPPSPSVDSGNGKAGVVVASPIVVLSTVVVAFQVLRR